MELECDLSSIQNEELLRKMWQQSEDINRKKEIRSQLYKVRESRLRDLYQFETMSDNRIAGFAKDPLAPSHGESLADQSFQSLKSREIRDSMSPTEMKFQSMTLNNPNTTGWNVQSSSEVSPDGRGFRAETIATTDGVENVNGGTAEFKGRNEQRSSAMHEGDDRNFVKKASESSNTHLQEKVVVGDENAGRTEVRTSSSTSTSSSKVFQSSSTNEYENGQPIQYLTDSNRAPVHSQEPQYRQIPSQYEPQATHDVRHLTDQSSSRQHYDHQSEQYRQNRQESKTSQNVQTNETHEQNKRYVDMDKASPEYQRHVQNLMSQPGEIISNTVEYPKPNVKMITTVKRLPDGTIVRNKRYETEETNPTPVPTHGSNTRQQTSSNQTTNLRRESQTNQQTKNYREPTEQAPSERFRQPYDNNVDNVERKHYTHDTQSDNVSNVETKYSTVKTSNRKFSTETTSEHVEEYDDRHGPTSPTSRAKPVTNSFSTHGFPSVRPNHPTQEFATDRPNLGHPSQNYTSPRDAVKPIYGEPSQNIVERRIPTSDGEVIILSSENRHNVKHQTNSERIIETDVRTTDDHRHQNTTDVTTRTTQDFSTHGFPSVREQVSHPTREYPDNRQLQPVGSNNAPGATAMYIPVNPNEDVVITSQKSHTTKHSTNTERIIETEIVDDDGRTRVVRPIHQGHSPSANYTVTTPGTSYSPNTPNLDFSTHGFPSVKSPTGSKPGYPSQGYPSSRSPTRSPNQDFSTHGFPSVKSPVGAKPDQGYPSARSPTRTTPGYAMPKGVNRPRGPSPVKSSPTTKKSSTTIEATERIIQKEKEVDAAHRAFAASLRSTSPVDGSPRRDSYSTDGPRHTPRSSVSSTRTFRRDIREGSHDSAAGSETSRVSHATVTRQTPPKTVPGGRAVVTKQTVLTTKNGNENLTDKSPRGSKSPSPGKTVTTTTTTRTVTSKALPKDVPQTDNHQHIATTTIKDSKFPINHEPLTITKTKFSENKTDNLATPDVIEVYEEPCIKKHMYLLYPSAPKNTVQRTESSPRSSPAPSSRSSPYTFKSRGPQGEDDQSIKSYNSRPLSPSSPTRSPKPIGSKDLPNSRGPRPTNTVSDEGRTIDRDTLITETTTIVDDYIDEDVDSLQKVKKTTKQLITHEKDKIPKTGTVKPMNTTSKQTTPKGKEYKRVIDTIEEPKRTKPNDQYQPARQKPSTTITSATLIFNEQRKAQTPKNVGPTRVIETTRKPQTKPSERQPEIPKGTKPKYPLQGNVDKPISSNVFETTEITVKTANKKKVETDNDEITVNLYSPQSKKVQPMQNDDKPRSDMRGVKPVRQQKPATTDLIVNERNVQRSHEVQPKNIVPGPYKSNSKPKYYELNDDDGECVPKSRHPDQEDYLDTEDDTTTSKVQKQSEIIVETTKRKIKGIEIDEEVTPYEERKQPQRKQFEPLPKETSPKRDIEAISSKVQPISPTKPRDIPKDKVQRSPNNRSPDLVNLSQTVQEVQPKNIVSGAYKSNSKPKYYELNDDDSECVPKRRHPDQEDYSDTEDDTTTSKVHKQSELVVETTKRKIKGNEIDEEVTTYEERKQPQRKQFEPIPKGPSPKSEVEVISLKVRPISPTKPRDIPNDKVQRSPNNRSPDLVNLSEIDEETVEKHYRETNETIVKTTSEHSPLQKETITLEDDYPQYTPRPIGKDAKKYEPLIDHNKELHKQIHETETNLDKKPKTLLDFKDEPIKPSSQETSTITLVTTNKTVSQKLDTKEFKPHEGEPSIRTSDDVLMSTITQHDTDTKRTEKTTKDLHEQFVQAERSTHHPERPDGAFVSKATEPVEPKSPTFKKKGVSRRDTFEDRCRQILGMENYGDTPGSYKPTSLTEPTEPVRKTVRTPKDDIEKSIFTVKIEDCGDDDDDDNEPLTIKSVRKTILEEKTTPSDTDFSDYEYPNKSKSKLLTTDKKIDKTHVKTTEEVHSGRPKGNLSDTVVMSDSESEVAYTNTKDIKDTRYTTKLHSTVKNEPIVESETIQITTTKRVDKTDDNLFNKTPTLRSPTRSPSPSKKPLPTEPVPLESTRVKTQKIESYASDKTTNLTSLSPKKTHAPTGEQKTPKEKLSPKSTSPVKDKFPVDSPKRKSDSPIKTTTTTDENISETTTIKDRLRSSTRKERIPKKPDQVDACSSPETSPSRYTERRRSSNISVNTEIIIEHTDSETVNKKTEKKPRTQTDSVYREIVETTRVPDKMPKKMAVTERKESAPVHRVTRKDKDSKMSRSTSENIIKVKKPEDANNLKPQLPKMAPKSPDHRRPNKCFATKTINLSTTDRLLTSNDMENVIIDIQQAKSSREPSPDKIVPTPVPAHLDTGKPRYPDVVQEPEDEPRKKPIVKNIPIFEEEHNNYVSCHITEVNIDKSRRTIDTSDYRDDEILNTPVIEAPQSLDYTQPSEIPDDESLLSVHDKVSKFQHIAKEVTKPKSSSPFNREFDDSTHVPEDDECLLTVDEKVEKFIKTAEKLTKETIVPERDTRRRIIEVTDDHDIDATECTYTPVKLGPSAPQKSPELVRHISRNISRQSDTTEPSVIEQEDYQHNTYESREKKIITKQGTQESVTHHHQKTSPVRPQPVTGDYNDNEDDDEELIPHTARHTTILEERRQKNILSRPSVFDNDKNKTPVKKTQPKYASPLKDVEKSTTTTTTSTIKSRAKPETPNRSSMVHVKTPASTTAPTSTRKQQSPQRPMPDTDYDYRRSSVEKGVSTNITNKQTQLHTISGPKKSPQQLNKKPDRQSPLRTNITKNVKQERNDVDNVDDVDDDDDANAEFEVVPNDRETQVIINTGTAIRSTTTKTTGKTNVRKEPTQVTSTYTSQTPRKMKENPISSTCSSPAKSTKTHLLDITERSTQKFNTTTTKTHDLHKSPETNESFAEKPTSKKPPLPHQSQTRTKVTTTDSVAARRSLFENKATTNTPRAPNSNTSSPGRRPSYMDHTKSSLEHIRRDSLELNKTNYTRKPSTEGDVDHENDDDTTHIDRDTQVKFVVPQNVRKNIDSTETEDDLNIEEIFDLVILERMLETVTSYEIRRRIRAQIRLIKKNLSNVHKKSETITTTTKSTTKPNNNVRDRSVSPLATVTTKKQYYYREEERTSSSSHTSPERSERITTTKVPRTHSPQLVKSTTPNGRSRSPQQQPTEGRVCAKEHERTYSPDSTRVISKVVSSSKHYDYRNEHEEQVKHIEKNIIESSSPTPRRSSRKSPSISSSPERHVVDNTKSPQQKPTTTYVRTTSRSPDNKVTTTMKTNSRYEQQSTVVKQPKSTPVANVPKGKPEQKAPVWADRKNVLKTPSTTSPKKPSTVTDTRTSSLNKTTKSTINQSQKTISKKSTNVEDDCITSSYGIGPTDENGLPLFGIRALKKKKPTADTCETTEEVTGYVVEEKYYSDNKTKPVVERKEVIYATNPKELEAMKEKVKETTIRKVHREEVIDDGKTQPLVTTTITTRSSPEDSYLESTTQKYVRRGSVKEMSEKFIHKESSSTVSEKSNNNYPKAGLILRTNSRRHSRDTVTPEGDNIDTYETRDFIEDNNDGFVSVRGTTHSTHRIVGESDDSESESMREFKKVTSSTSSSSRSFLNAKGEEKIITNVNDVLDRMRNADNVVEDGDTVEDQEARALLNKFLGASIIMKGVETSIPINRETKMITTTSTSSGQQPKKQEVKTTRVTKTFKSGSSSSPVTSETTCDIEEIWDVEILKQLLEQARTYEERRKIRSRLRELMAERPEKKKDCQAVTESAADTINEQSTVERSESSASEYEEIIEIIEEEVTDDSSIESEKPNTKEAVTQESASLTSVSKESKSSPTVPFEETDNSVESNKSPINTAEDTPPVTVESHTVPESNDKTDSTDKKGESPQPAPQDTMHQQKAIQNNTSATQKLGVISSYSKTPGGNTPKSNINNSSDDSMHGPYNKSSTLAQYTKQTPILTVTPGSRDVNSASVNNTSDMVGSTGIQVDRLGVPQKEDSGTESGEDLRLIAAGLRDQLQMKSDSNIIDDVTCALSRLENSLKEGKDITVDAEKRKALLALVARLQDGLTSPEKLAEIAAAMSELDGNDVLYGETSSPEADAHRSGKQRFAKRRNRVNRHTVGVSREELADARRYMEDMLIMENISNNTTPDASTNSAPQWFPLEKNASSGAILVQQSRRQNYFLDNAQDSTVQRKISPTNGNKRRPVSGDFSVSFQTIPSEDEVKYNPPLNTESVDQRMSPENGNKNPRFSNKKLLMKRANTIDLAKAKRIGSDFDTDSEAEEKSQLIGLKRAIHPTVKKRAQNVVPPFEPKTENDRKFLAFINKQSDKPGLGWTSSRSVSNWTNKFGNLKNSFEIGATTAVTAAKPPQVPGHQLKLNTAIKQPAPQQRDVYQYVPTNQQIAQRLQQEADRQAEERRRKLEYEAHHQRGANSCYSSNQQIAQRLLQEADRQAEERRRNLEYERMKYEQREREKIERQRHLQMQQQQQQERLQKERLEREYYERHIRDHDNRTQRVQHASPNNIPQPMPINEFKHAPQSVFRPIDNGDTIPKPIYKPIPQLPTTTNTWQPPTANNNPFAKADNSFITSPPPSSKSPIGLPWAAKPAVDASSFKSKANRFEERSKYDNVCNAPQLQRHNSLRMPNIISTQNDDFKKRPSLPNTTDPYGIHQMQSQQSSLSYLPPPTNISYVYDSRPSKPTYLSYPCLPTAVSESNNYRGREDSLTNPQATPLVLTSANPSYGPTNQQTGSQQFMPRDQMPHLDIVSPAESTLTSPSGPSMTALQTDYTDDDIESDSLLEYRAVSRVMAKPQSQTAITVGRRTGHVSDDEVYGKNSKAAKNLLSTMKNIGGDAKRPTRTVKRTEAPTSPKVCLSPDGRSYQAPIVEPLFPDVTRFESNRQPQYDSKVNDKPTPTSYTQHQRKKPTMYKSMENVSMRPSAPSKNNMYVPQQQPTLQPQLKPYVSETQTSYVVTYPVDDTTDDEEVYRHSKQMVPDCLPLRRTRNISETSTVSSTTASTTYANNIPSPNTSWTSNPITADVTTAGQNFYNYPSNERLHQQAMQGAAPPMVAPMPPQYQHNQSPTVPQYQQSFLEPKKKETKSQTSRNTNYTTGAAPYKKSSQHGQPLSTINYNNYDSFGQTATAAASGIQVQETTVHKVTPKPQPSKQEKQQVQPQQIVQTQSQKIPSSKAKQSPTKNTPEKPTNKKSLANTGKSVSADYQDINKMSSLREQTTTIKVSQKSTAATAKKVNQQQSESVSTNTTRRQSYGNAVNGQNSEESRATESHQQTIYKSSAPADTPDIVKSSLPKDENQPILKKFGPPQRHHYMPNSYKTPGSNTDKASTTTVHTKSIEMTTNKSILKTTQQTAKSSKPIIVENPATPQPDDDYIPRNIVFNNVHAFTSMSRRQDEDRSQLIDLPVRTNKLCKSESWKQIINLQNQNMPQPTPRLPQPPINELRRTKSGHTLALPKMYEAAIDKTEICEKQNIMAAYFAANKSPTQQEQTFVEQTKRSVINRTKTSEKISASRKSLGSHAGPSQGGLTRSATMPHIANVNLLDESNVEDAFEQLMMEQQKSSTSTTEKTETKEQDGAVVTTTTKVTTRTVAGGTTTKTASPFAKFKQLDRQSSQQSAKSPTTPGSGSTASPTVTGNATIFKFTDPALNARAATVKDQLLQWCQLKTQEYENVQITNFSASWVDGLAFCALIHHFLPDAFDYSQLTPQNRRKNFELAFTVADEKAGIAPLLDVEDMVVMKRPDWKCVFVYVQSIYRRFRNCQ